MKRVITAAVLVFLSLAAVLPDARADVAYAEGFQFFSARQKTPVWCWAACIQMMLNYKGIHWSQEDVVAAVKGYTAVRTASDQEIYHFLNQWGFDYDGQTWASRCAYYRGAPMPAWLIGELAADRPLIVSYNTGPGSAHVVVLHRANFTRTPLGPRIDSVVIFDPLTGANYTVAPQAVLHTTTGHWFVDVHKTF